jgi:hypothetical protein
VTSVQNFSVGPDYLAVMGAGNWVSNECALKAAHVSQRSRLPNLASLFNSQCTKAQTKVLAVESMGLQPTAIRPGFNSVHGQCKRTVRSKNLEGTSRLENVQPILSVRAVHVGPTPRTLRIGLLGSKFPLAFPAEAGKKPGWLPGLIPLLRPNRKSAWCAESKDIPASRRFRRGRFGRPFRGTFRGVC